MAKRQELTATLEAVRIAAPTWEYLVSLLGDPYGEAELNVWGSAGWELIQIRKGYAYFKRMRRDAALT